MTSRRSWAALLTLFTGLALAGASAAEHPAPPRPTDAGPPRLQRDGGVAGLPRAQDAGTLSPEDVEVMLNLELLEHLPESDVLELLLPVRDE